MEEKDVVTTENFEGEHIYTFLLTPHKHDMPKLVLLHLPNHAKFILLNLVKLVIAF
jgi:hypothetical protein